MCLSKKQNFKYLCVLAIGLFPLVQTARSVETKKLFPVSGFSKSNAAPVPQNTPPYSPNSSRTEITRLKILIKETRDFVFGIAPTSVIAVSPEIASAAVKSGNFVTVSGLKVGETILIVSDSERRLTVIIEVVGNFAAKSKKRIDAQKRVENETQNTSGAYSVSYAGGFGGNASLLRQNFEFRRKLANDKTLRFSGETFKFIETGEREQTFAKAQGLGIDRIMFGVDAPYGTLDVMDSPLNLSALSFNNYTMRGFHLASAPESRLGGIELFAGLARPSVSLFDKDGGRVVGVFSPTLKKHSFSFRAGVFNIAPEKNNRSEGGTIWQLSGAFAPTEAVTIEAEAAFAAGDLSWRARMDFRQKAYGVFGEITRFSPRSPLISIGAQPGGRDTEALAVHWRPFNRVNVSVNYNHTALALRFLNRSAAFDRTTFSANAGFSISRSSTLNLRLTDQQIESTVPGNASSHFAIKTRTATVNYNARFSPNWANNFEARLTSSRETQANAAIENGFHLSEQLRFSWKRNAATAFFSYTHKTPSLTSLIVRNPQLLSPLQQQAFTADPTGFLRLNRDALGLLLPGVELPQTRSFDAGLRFQTTISRFDLTGETRYNAGEVFAFNQRSVSVSLSANARLDAANSLQLSGWKSFDLNAQNSQAAFTISYTHRFGAGSGEGFQFGKFFGLNRGQIKGRVFLDLNGNGLDDANEPGLAGMNVRIDEKRSVKTGSNGHFNLSAQAGEHNVALASDDLGVRLRASTPTEQQVVLSARRTANVSFGVSDFGTIAGRVFNDLTLTGASVNNLPGINGVRLVLRSTEKADLLIDQPTDSIGNYEFRNLRPGNYTLEIDVSTLPPNFRLSGKTSWSIKVEPVGGFYLDIPLAANRAIAGIVFADKDGDGKFNRQIDEPIEGALIIAGGASEVSDKSGAYLLRNLPAGKIKLFVRISGAESLPVTIELDAAPNTQRGVNFMIK